MVLSSMLSQAASQLGSVTRMHAAVSGDMSASG